MLENILDKYADVLLWALETARKNKPLQKDDLIFVRYHEPARPLAEKLFEKIIEREGHPVVRPFLSPSMERAFFGKASDEQLSFHTPGQKELYSSLNGSISLLAPESMTHLAGLNSSRMGIFSRSNKIFKDILDERDAKGLFGWTLCIYPTKAMADEAGLSLEKYTSEVLKACFLDTENPVEHWKEILAQATRTKEWLNSLDVEHFHLSSENCELIIKPGRQRRWLGLSGHNMPSFELFLSPDWRGTEGVFYADQMSFRSGNKVSGVRLEFSKGEIVRAEAELGEAFLLEQLKTDEGARRIGEFSLTDKRFSRISRFMANTLFDENYGGDWGNSHIAIGSAYVESFSGDVSRLDSHGKKELGFNDSALHWDLVNTGKKSVVAKLRSGREIEIYKDGLFLAPS